jgi:DNA polymerase (family 10)
MKGDLHVHTKRTDGSHDIDELVKAARKLGYEYIAITDHSKGLGIAKGLDEERLLEEMREIDALNRKLKGFRVLKGIEVDIRSDYTLDLPDELLEKLDIVVASVHSGFKQSRDKITQRLVRAMENPLVSVIAHPTGRLIGEREAYDVDIEKVLRTARETATAVEINAYPLRLDLKDAHVKTAKELSVPIAINTDTHLLSHFGYMAYGIGVARRGWLEKKDVINTLGYKGLAGFLGKKRKK